MEFTQLGKIYIDGTKIKGSASAKRTKDQVGFEKWLSNIKENISGLMQKMRKKLLSTEGKSKYFKCQYTIGPVFVYT